RTTPEPKCGRRPCHGDLSRDCILPLNSGNCCRVTQDDSVNHSPVAVVGRRPSATGGCRAARPPSGRLPNPLAGPRPGLPSAGTTNPHCRSSLVRLLPSSRRRSNPWGLVFFGGEHASCTELKPEGRDANEALLKSD